VGHSVPISLNTCSPGVRPTLQSCPKPIQYRGSISSGHRPIGAELEQMVIIEGLLMEVVSIVVRHPLNPLCPVVKDKFQFRPLNCTQKFLNSRMRERRSSGPGSCCSASTAFVYQKPEARSQRCQARTVRRMGCSNNRILSKKFPEDSEWWTRQLSRCTFS
jgi:hypothetical protein